MERSLPRRSTANSAVKLRAPSELKALQKENARLKKLVADQALDMDILKEAAKGNW